MGWFRDSHPGHEGFAVGMVTRDQCNPASGLYRELSYPRDDAQRVPERIQAGCDCGWRSPHWKPESGAGYHPYSVGLSERDDERVHDLWNGHLEHTPT